MRIRVTEGVKAVLEATGCRPLRCHACAELVKVGDELGQAEGYFVHAACEGREITLPIDEAVRKKIQAEIEAVGGLAKALSGELGDWKTETVSKGPVFTFNEVATALARGGR